MKVLWLSNTPALGIEYLNKDAKIKGSGGWMYALNTILQDEVELSVAFHYPYKKVNFFYQKTHYFPIFTGNIVIENLKKRFLTKVYDEDFSKEYLKIIQEVKPDIIHIHGTENSFLCILTKVDVPVVISIQGNLNVVHHKFKAGFHGKYLKEVNDKISSKSLLFGRYSFYVSYKNMQKMAKIEQRHLKFAKNIIGRTDWDRRITRILAPISTYYKGNELLRDSFYEMQWSNNYRTGKIILFTTNGNTYYKGFETICHSITLLKGIGLNLEWRIAGISKNSLINKISKKQLGENYPHTGLLFLGSLDEAELINNLQQSHVYIMASHIENSPNNLCEAMILGMPCIATFAGGTSSMLEDGREGLLIQDGDPWSMAGAILELIHNPSKAVQLGVKARERALVRHNQKTIVSQLLNTYSTIIAGSNAR